MLFLPENQLLLDRLKLSCNSTICILPIVRLVACLLEIILEALDVAVESHNFSMMGDLSNMTV